MPGRILIGGLSSFQDYADCPLKRDVSTGPEAGKTIGLERWGMVLGVVIQGLLRGKDIARLDTDRISRPVYSNDVCAYCSAREDSINMAIEEPCDVLA